MLHPWHREHPLHARRVREARIGGTASAVALLPRVFIYDDTYVDTWYDDTYVDT